MAGSANITANDNTLKTKGSQGGSVKQVTMHKKAAYLQSLNESEKAANFKIIDKMNKRINFLRNPRFKANKAPITLNKVSGLVVIYRNQLARPLIKIIPSSLSQSRFCLWTTRSMVFTRSL
jgi:hypothetical protein